MLFVKAADLVRQLLEARDDRELGRLQMRLRRVSLLIIDELGFVPFDRAGGELTPLPSAAQDSAIAGAVPQGA